MELKGKIVLAVILLTSVVLNYCVSVPVGDREKSYAETDYDYFKSNDPMWYTKKIGSTILTFFPFWEEQHQIEILPNATTSIEKSTPKSPWYISSYNELKSHENEKFIGNRDVNRSKRSGKNLFNLVTPSHKKSIQFSKIIITPIVSSAIGVAKNRIGDANATNSTAVAVAKPQRNV